jgi:hypothetical protein
MVPLLDEGSGYYSATRGEWDRFLKPEYRGFPGAFWGVIQGLHDTASFWTQHSDGLSAAGMQRVKEIREMIPGWEKGPKGVT